MGFAILCLLAVYGLGAMLLTLYESVFYRNRCRGCRVSLHAELDGGECCEWTARQLLFEVRNSRLPITGLTLSAADRETAALLRRLCKDAATVTIRGCEDSENVPTDYRDSDGDCLCQP